MKIVNAHSHFPSPTEITVLQDTTEITSGISSFGVHPVLDEKNVEYKLQLLEKYASEGKIVAIGECGFDKNSRLFVDEQISTFRRQTELSVKCDLPVIIHCVGRWNELELMFKEKKADSPAWIIHGFRKMKLAQKFLDLGAYLSFGEALLFDETIHSPIKDMPLDRIFLETDDKEFEIRKIYEKLAELRDIHVDSVADQVFRNFTAVFGKVGHNYD